MAISALEKARLELYQSKSSTARTILQNVMTDIENASSAPLVYDVTGASGAVRIEVKDVLKAFGFFVKIVSNEATIAW